MFRQRGLPLLLALLLLCLHPCRACLNDRDTLASEAQAHPDILSAITGRFERNPPLYYEMRIARAKADLTVNPYRVDEYDDIAVAYDRLGDDRDALAWIARKKARLPKYDPADLFSKEQWYRYYANSGTFAVHRWIRFGADRARIGEVIAARDQIAHAVAIKPNAHFGREKYQLKVMDWLIQCSVPGQSATPLTHALGDPGGGGEGATALAGLITLGNAWESVDVYQALESRLQVRHPALAGMANLRVHELLASGRKPLVPEAFDKDLDAADHGDAAQSGSDSLAQEYRRQREEADAWQEERREYMMERLGQGRHPDTDHTFWSDWHDAGPPEIRRPMTPRDRLALFTTVASWSIAVVCIGIVGAIAFVKMRRERRGPV